MEILIVLTPIGLCAPAMLDRMPSAGFSQKPDDQVDARSVALSQQAAALNAQGRYADATDLLQTALAVDPSNRAAYIGLAKAAQGEKLPGKAVKFYYEALKLEPNDVNALAGQGE